MNKNITPETFFEACKSGNLDIVKIYLAQPENNPNIQDSDDCTGLIYASRCHHLEIVQELLNRGVFPDIRDYSGWTALFYACWQNQLEIVKELLNHRSNPNIKTSDNWTPLHMACQHNYREITRELLLVNADWNIKNNCEKSPLDYAQKSPELMEIFKPYIERNKE